MAQTILIVGIDVVDQDVGLELDQRRLFSVSTQMM
jgi:hypothetical protein